MHNIYWCMYVPNSWLLTQLFWFHCWIWLILTLRLNKKYQNCSKFGYFPSILLYFLKWLHRSHKSLRSRTSSSSKSVTETRELLLVPLVLCSVVPWADVAADENKNWLRQWMNINSLINRIQYQLSSDSMELINILDQLWDGMELTNSWALKVSCINLTF